MKYKTVTISEEQERTIWEKARGSEIELTVFPVCGPTGTVLLAPLYAFSFYFL